MNLPPVAAAATPTPIKSGVAWRKSSSSTMLIIYSKAGFEKESKQSEAHHGRVVVAMPGSVFLFRCYGDVNFKMWRKRGTLVYCFIRTASPLAKQVTACTELQAFKMVEFTVCTSNSFVVDQSILWGWLLGKTGRNFVTVLL